MQPPATPPPPSRMRPLLPALPLLLCAAVLLAPLLLSLLLVALRVAGDASPLRMRLEQLQAPGMGGMHTPAPTPQWSAANLASGRWQQQFDAWWNTRLPLRGLFVRATNQAYYSLFGKSHALQRRVAIGREHQLFHLDHVEGYCNWHRAPPDISGMRAWARGIREVQDYFTRRGQAFVYVLAPTKPPGRFDHLPPGMACPATPPSNYSVLVPALAQAGVTYIDGPRLVGAARPSLPDELLFPAGGFHWTELGAALVMREALQAAGRARGPGPDLTLPAYSYRVDRHPAGMEAELADILNLWRPNKDYPVPRVDFASATSPPRALRMAMVGDSFLNHAADLVARSGRYATVDHFYYFSREHRQYVDGRVTRPVNSGIAPSSYAALLAADVVVLEETQLDAGGRHVQLLRQHLGMPPRLAAGK